MSNQDPPAKRTVLPFYRKKEWFRARALVLRRDDFSCVFCGADVKERGKSRVDHIIPYKERPDLGLEMNNLRTLCASCDNSRHAYDRAKSIVKKKPTGTDGAPLGESGWV